MPLHRIDPRLGPVLRVRVDQGRVWREMVEQAEGLTGTLLHEAVEVLALVDTGAAMTCITGPLAASMGLAMTGSVQVEGIRAHHGAPAIDGFAARRHLRLRFDRWSCELSAAEVQEILSPGPDRVQMLLGRDFLAHARFVYDGRAGVFELEPQATRPG